MDIVRRFFNLSKDRFCLLNFRCSGFLAKPNLDYMSNWIVHFVVSINDCFHFKCVLPLVVNILVNDSVCVDVFSVELCFDCDYFYHNDYFCFSVAVGAAFVTCNRFLGSIGGNAHFDFSHVAINDSSCLFFSRFVVVYVIGRLCGNVVGFFHFFCRRVNDFCVFKFIGEFSFRSFIG